MGREMWLRTPTHPWLPFSQEENRCRQEPLQSSPFSLLLKPSPILASFCPREAPRPQPPVPGGAWAEARH